MTLHERIRVAVQLQKSWQLGQERQLESLPAISKSIARYIQYLQQCESQMKLARSRGLLLIESMQEEKVLYQARSLRITLQDLEADFPMKRHRFALRDFYDDLIQLEEEFVDVRVNWPSTTLIVETEPIILEGLELGPFTIRLNWKQWFQEATLSCLTVIAEEPNTAELNSDVTHPHVREGELCAGDALTPLQKAFEEGRLAEAFLIVRAVLSHYNPKSAYVQLDDWNGIPCYDCGVISAPDDRTYCEGCDHDYCSSCINNCSHCSTKRCIGCLNECSVCEEQCCCNCSETSSISEQMICRNCQEVCTGCLGITGPDELHADSGLCPGCSKSLPLSEETIHEAIEVSAS